MKFPRRTGRRSEIPLSITPSVLVHDHSPSSHYPNLNPPTTNPRPNPLHLLPNLPSLFLQPEIPETIATDRLPLAGARLSGSKDRRHTPWHGCG
jgi:hypothetical protein